MRNITTEARLREILVSGPFQEFLGLELLACDIEAGTVEVRLPWRPEFERGSRTAQWHGGAIAALIDIVGDLALACRVGRGLPTIDLRIDFLRPAIDTDLLASGSTIRAGRSVGLANIVVKNNAGTEIAVGRGCYSTIPPGGHR